MELYFDNIDNQIAQLIKNAKTSIRVTSAYYTSEKLTDELCHASENNIDVQLIVDTKFGEDKALNLFKKLVKANALVYIQTIPHADNIAIMHNKFCIIDGYILITGSFNWTNNGARNNEENIIVVKNRKLAQKALAKFNKLRNDARTKGFENNNKDRIEKCSEYDEYCDPSYKDEELPLFPKIEYFRSNDEYSCFHENESIIISWEIKDCDNYDIFLYEKYNEKEKVAKKGSKNFNYITKDTDFILEVSNSSGTTIVRVLHINIPILANIEVSAPKFTIAVPPIVPFPTLPFFSNIDTVSSNDSVMPIVTALKSKVERLESITLQHLQLIYPVNDPITSIQIPNLQKKVLVLINELQPIKQELTNTKIELSDIKIKLTNTKQELTNAKQEVANAKQELTNAKQEVANAKKRATRFK
jgi:hypothetical protein